MTEPAPFSDALTAPFWQAAQQGALVLQRCRTCGRVQFYPRPFCLSCMSDEVEWAEASGYGLVYAVTTVRMNVLPDLEPPYDIALVDLDEGVRMLVRVEERGVSIGDRVEVTWDTSRPEPVMLARHIDREVQ